MLNLFLKSENLVVPSQASPRIGQMFITMSMFDSFLYLGMPRPEIEISKEGSEFMMTIENKRKKFKQRTSSEDFECFQEEDTTETMSSKDFNDDDIDSVEVKDLEMISLVGEGLQGSVYLVENKVNNCKFNCDSTYEAKVLEKLKHDFIVKLVTSYETSNYNAILLEFCKGGDLFFHLKKVCKAKRLGFAEQNVKFYICAVALALQHIHENDFIYCDLKPENILIDHDGYPKLCDFGLTISCNESEFKTLRKPRGSGQYFAPEIIERKGYRKEIDWWCLGILTYELLFGKTPFKNYNIFSQNLMIRTKNPDYSKRKDLSPECIDFISKLLTKSADKRLGRDGISELKSHPWTSDIDWDSLVNRKLDPPYKLKKDVQ